MKITPADFQTSNSSLQTSSIPFDTSAYDAKMDPNDSILSIAERLAKYGGGGTDCSLPLVAANQKHAKRKFAGIVLVSDNESWVGTGRHERNCEVRIVKCETMKVQCIRIFQTSNFLIQTSIAFLADNNQRFVAEVEAIEL